MTNLSFLLDLKKTFPPETFSWVVAGLRHDPTVWGQLRDPDFGARALASMGDRPECWSPASLSLLALEQAPSLDLLHKLPLLPIDPKTRTQAASTFEQAANRPSPPPTLVESAQLALILRERFRIEEAWEALIPGLPFLAQPHWRTPLACLMGMLPYSPALPAALAVYPACRHACVHMLLSQPLSPGALASRFEELLELLPAAQQLAVLEALQRQRPKLAAALSRTLTGQDSLPPETALALAELSLDPKENLPRLAAALQALQARQANLTIRFAHFAGLAGDTRTSLKAWKKAVKLAPENTEARGGLCLALIEAGQPEEARDLLEVDQPIQASPGLALAAALLAFQTDEAEAARQAALQALDALQASPESPHAPRIAAILLDLGLPTLAAQAAQFALAQNPTDPARLAALSKAQLAGGEIDAGLEQITLAYALNPLTALAPENQGLHRQLAGAFEFAGRWETALPERKAILDAPPLERGVGGDQLDAPKSVDSPRRHTLHADLLAYANCALHAGELKTAAEACQQAITLHPKDGLAHAMLGEVLVAQNDPAAAQEHFHQATFLTPHKPGPWLALARASQQAGQPQKAIDALQAATLAVPNNPELLLELGKAHYAQGLAPNSPTQAAEALRQAARLLPNMAIGDLALETAENLGRVLLDLGHHEEARAALEPAFKATPTHLDLAKVYASVLLALKNYPAALAPLTKILQANPTEPGPYLDYAQVVLRIGKTPGEALPALETALSLAPQGSEDHDLALALRAEALNPLTALAANEDLQQGLNAYQQALETRLAKNPEWLARLSIGMGKTALALAQPETAIASLQEASRANPKNPEIPRLLSQAYLEADLPHDAFEAAQLAMYLSPDNLDTLVWFAENTLKYHTKSNGKPATTHNLRQAEIEAIQSIQRAIQLAPERPDLLLRLGQAQMQTGDRDGAWNSFSKLLALSQATMMYSSSTTGNADLVQALVEAAQGFLGLDDASSAVACLENARFLSPRADNPLTALQLLSDLARAHQKAGSSEIALQIVETTLTQNPEVPDLYLLKADLLLDLQRPQAALACLEHALMSYPNRPEFHRRAAGILRAEGDLPAALAHAQQWLSLAAPGSTPAYQARLTAAEIARSLLDPEQARKLLTEGGPDTALPGLLEGENQLSLSYACLAGELALELDEEIAAAHHLTQATQLDPTHVRTRALLACVTNRRGDHLSAVALLDEILETHGIFPAHESRPPDAAQRGSPTLALRPGSGQALRPGSGQALDALSLLALAETAIQLGAWNAAVFLSRKATEALPLEPLPYIQHVSALVLRAEVQRLSDELEIVKHAPGPAALSSHAYQAFLRAIEQAAGCTMPKSKNDRLTRWRIRGLAAFHASPSTSLRAGEKPSQTIPQLSKTPEDAAASMAAFRNMGNPQGALQAARFYPAHPLVQVQMALSLARQDARKAFQVARNLAASPAVLGNSGITPPLLQALVAQLAHRDGDLQEALKALKKALTYWPDEARWHAFAARIYLTLAEFDPAQRAAALPHQEQAAQLEPGHIPHHLALANIHLQEEAYPNVIQTLEKATQISPAHPEPWYYLGQAHLATGDLAQAALCADRAIELNPEEARPILLRAKIALEADDPKGAHKLAQNALKLNPHDTGVVLVLSRGLAALDRPEEALTALESAIQLASDPLPLQMERICLLRRTRGPKSALEALEPLAKAHPENPAVLAPLAETLAAAGNTEAAIGTAQRALQAGAAKLSTGEQAHLHLLLGRLLRCSRQLDQAVHHLSLAARHAPSLIEACLELGQAHHDRREHEASLLAYQQAMQAAPSDPRAYYQAALVLKDSRDYKHAEAMLRHAADLSPADLNIHRQLGALVALNLVHNRV